MGRRRLLLLAVAALPALGCYTTWDIGPRNINTLHAENPPAAKAVVIDAAGESVQMDRDTELVFGALVPTVEALDVKFESLEVHGSPGEPEGWWVSGVLRGDGRGIRIDMSQVASLKAKRYSQGKTALLVTGVIVGAIAVVAATTVAIAIAVSSNTED
jgi:hypothetical protein